MVDKAVIATIDILEMVVNAIIAMIDNGIYWNSIKYF